MRGQRREEKEREREKQRQVERQASERNAQARVKASEEKRRLFLLLDSSIDGESNGIQRAAAGDQPEGARRGQVISTFLSLDD